MSAAVLTRASNGHFRRVFIIALAALLLFTVLAIVPGATGVHADGGDYSMRFLALDPDAYDPATGLLVGSDNGQRPTVSSLEGGDFVCGDLVWYTVKIDITGSPPPGEVLEATYEFPVTGVNGNLAGHVELFDATIDTGWSGHVDTGTPIGFVATGQHYEPGGGIPSSTYPDPVPDFVVAWFQATGFDAGDSVMLKGLVRLGCGDTSRTANITPKQRTAYADGDAVPGTGAETIPFKSFGPPESPSIAIEKATNGSDADTPTGPYIPVGDSVDWTYVVTNNGSVELTNVSVSDDQGVAVSCPATRLARDASMTCTATGIAMPGQYANVGTATGEYAPKKADTIVVTDTDPSHYFGIDSSIDIEKATNGSDADTPTGPYVPVGDAVVWTYLVSNTGNVPLTNVAVVDDQGVAVSCPQDALAIAESMTCAASGVAELGQYANLGTATGVDPSQATVRDEDPSHYYGLVSSIDIEKATNGFDADTPTGPMIPVGDSVEWTYVVTNTGNTPLTEISVIDDVLGTINCPSDSLSAFESMICTASGLAELGQYANLGTATGLSTGNGIVTDEDLSHYYGTVTGGIDIEKATNGSDADTPTGPMIPAGDPVTWTYLVTNNTNVTLTTVAVHDSDLGAISCPKTTLVAGESMTCTASGVAVAGQYANLGDVSGLDAAGSPVGDTDPSHYYGVEGNLTLEKATNGSDADAPTGPYVPVGDAVTWTYVVTNGSNSTVTAIALGDSDLGAISCPKTTLVAGESMTCTASGVAVAGQYANLGDVSGLDAAGSLVGDTDPSHYYGLTTGIEIEKSTNDQDADTPTGPYVAVGDPVNWEYRVRNLGNTEISNVVVTDNKEVTPLYVSGDLDLDNKLDPIETWIYKVSGVAVAGQYANVGTATGDATGDGEVTDTDPSHYYGVLGGIDIEKATNGEDADTPTGPNVPAGDAVAWTYAVINTGNSPLAEVAVTDDQGIVPTFIGGDTNDDGLLDPDELWIYKATGVAVAGQYANVGTVEATVSGLQRPESLRVAASPRSQLNIGDTATDADPSHYFGSAPEIDVVKNVEPSVIPVNSPGDTSTEVMWTITVTNTGNVPLHGVVLTDTLVPACDLAIGDLAVGDSTTYQCKSIHTPDNLAWTFTNVAVTTGIGPAGTEVTAEDDARIDPIYVAGTGEIGDKVWLDKDEDGFQDADEPGINGAKVLLKDAGGTVIATVTTAHNTSLNVDGWYKFVGLDAGTYTSQLDTSSVSGDLTTPGAFTINLADGEEYLDADFGIAEELPKTGFSSAELALLALLLLVLGTLAVLGANKWGFVDD